MKKLIPLLASLLCISPCFVTGMSATMSIAPAQLNLLKAKIEQLAAINPDEMTSGQYDELNQALAKLLQSGPATKTVTGQSVVVLARKKIAEYEQSKAEKKKLVEEKTKKIVLSLKELLADIDLRADLAGDSAALNSVEKEFNKAFTTLKTTIELLRQEIHPNYPIIYSLIAKEMAEIGSNFNKLIAKQTPGSDAAQFLTQHRLIIMTNMQELLAQSFTDQINQLVPFAEQQTESNNLFKTISDDLKEKFSNFASQFALYKELIQNNQQVEEIQALFDEKLPQAINIVVEKQLAGINNLFATATQEIGTNELANFFAQTPLDFEEIDGQLNMLSATINKIQPMLSDELYIASGPVTTNLKKAELPLAQTIHQAAASFLDAAFAQIQSFRPILHLDLKKYKKKDLDQLTSLYAVIAQGYQQLSTLAQLSSFLKDSAILSPEKGKEFAETFSKNQQIFKQSAEEMRARIKKIGGQSAVDQLPPLIEQPLAIKLTGTYQAIEQSLAQLPALLQQGPQKFAEGFQALVSNFKKASLDGIATILAITNLHKQEEEANRFVQQYRAIETKLKQEPPRKRIADLPTEIESIASEIAIELLNKLKQQLITTIKPTVDTISITDTTIEMITAAGQNPVDLANRLTKQLTKQLAELKPIIFMLEELAQNNLAQEHMNSEKESPLAQAMQETEKQNKEILTIYQEKICLPLANALQASAEQTAIKLFAQAMAQPFKQFFTTMSDLFLLGDDEAFKTALENCFAQQPAVIAKEEAVETVMPETSEEIEEEFISAEEEPAEETVARSLDLLQSNDIAAALTAILGQTETDAIKKEQIDRLVSTVEGLTKAAFADLLGKANDEEMAQEFKKLVEAYQQKVADFKSTTGKAGYQAAHPLNLTYLCQLIADQLEKEIAYIKPIKKEKSSEEINYINLLESEKFSVAQIINILFTTSIGTIVQSIQGPDKNKILQTFLNSDDAQRLLVYKADFQNLLEPSKTAIKKTLQRTELLAQTYHQLASCHLDLTDFFTKIFDDYQILGIGINRAIANETIPADDKIKLIAFRDSFLNGMQKLSDSLEKLKPSIIFDSEKIKDAIKQAREKTAIVEIEAPAIAPQTGAKPSEEKPWQKQLTELPTAEQAAEYAANMAAAAQKIKDMVVEQLSTNFLATGKKRTAVLKDITNVPDLEAKLTNLKKLFETKLIPLAQESAGWQNILHQIYALTPGANEQKKDAAYKKQFADILTISDQQFAPAIAEILKKLVNIVHDLNTLAIDPAIVAQIKTALWPTFGTFLTTLLARPIPTNEKVWNELQTEFATPIIKPSLTVEQATLYANQMATIIQEIKDKVVNLLSTNFLQTGKKRTKVLETIATVPDLSNKLAQLRTQFEESNLLAAAKKFYEWQSKLNEAYAQMPGATPQEKNREFAQRYKKVRDITATTISPAIKEILRKFTNLVDDLQSVKIDAETVAEIKNSLWPTFATFITTLIPRPKKDDQKAWQALFTEFGAQQAIPLSAQEYMEPTEEEVVEQARKIEKVSKNIKGKLQEAFETNFLGSNKSVAEFLAGIADEQNISEKINYASKQFSQLMKKAKQLNKEQENIDRQTISTVDQAKKLIGSADQAINESAQIILKAIDAIAKAEQSAPTASKTIIAEVKNALYPVLTGFIKTIAPYLKPDLTSGIEQAIKGSAVPLAIAINENDLTNLYQFSNDLNLQVERAIDDNDQNNQTLIAATESALHYLQAEKTRQLFDTIKPLYNQLALLDKNDPRIAGKNEQDAKEYADVIAGKTASTEKIVSNLINQKRAELLEPGADQEELMHVVDLLYRVAQAMQALGLTSTISPEIEESHQQFIAAQE